MERLQSDNFRDELSQHRDPLPYADLQTTLSNLEQSSSRDPQNALAHGLIAFNQLTLESQLPDYDNRIYSILTAEKSRLGGSFFATIAHQLNDQDASFAAEYATLLNRRADILYEETMHNSNPHLFTQAEHAHPGQPDYKNYRSIKPLSYLLLHEKQQTTSRGEDVTVSDIVELCQARLEFQQACDEPNLHDKQKQLNSVLEKLIHIKGIDDGEHFPIQEAINGLVLGRCVHDLAILNEFANDSNPNQSRDNAIKQSIDFLHTAHSAFKRAEQSLPEGTINFHQILEEIDYFCSIYTKEISEPTESVFPDTTRLGFVALQPTLQRAA